MGVIVTANDFYQNGLLGITFQAGETKTVTTDIFRKLMQDRSQNFEMLAFPPAAVVLNADAGAGASQIQVDAPVPLTAPHLYWLVIDPFTDECEIKKVTAESPNRLTLTLHSNLTYAHSTGDLVLWVVEPVVNVKWFGAKGDGTTDDYTAIQRAVNQNLGDATYRSTVYYFPIGEYRVNTSIDMTNRMDWMMLGEGQLKSRIISHATARPAIDILGGRFFVIEKLGIDGDTTNTPACAFFSARTSAVQNVTNGIFRDVTLQGKYTAAGWYMISSEETTWDRCRTLAIDSPYVIYVDKTNSQSVVSDYRTVFTGFQGQTMNKVRNCRFSTEPTGNNGALFLGDVTHWFSVRDTYWTSYGTGRGVTLEGNMQCLTLDNIYQEPSTGTFMHLNATANVQNLMWVNTGNVTTQLTTDAGSRINGAFINGLMNSAGGGTDVFTFHHVSDSIVQKWWNNQGDNMQINGDSLDTIFYQSHTGTITVVGNDSGSIYYKRASGAKGFALGTNTGLAVGAGSQFQVIYSATDTHDPGTVGNGSRSHKTVVLVGIEAGDPAFVGVSPALADNVDVVWKTISGAVRVTFINNTGGNWAPGVLTIRVTAFDYT